MVYHTEAVHLYKNHADSPLKNSTNLPFWAIRSQKHRTENFGITQNYLQTYFKDNTIQIVQTHLTQMRLYRIFTNQMRQF